MDSTTLQFKGMYNAHKCEVTGLYFQDSQHYLISMSIEGEISVWDAQRMVIVQVVRNKQYMQAN